MDECVGGKVEKNGRKMNVKNSAMTDILEVYETRRTTKTPHPNLPLFLGPPGR